MDMVKGILEVQLQMDVIGEVLELVGQRRDLWVDDIVRGGVVYRRIALLIDITTHGADGVQFKACHDAVLTAME